MVITLKIEEVNYASAGKEVQENLLQIEQKGILLTPFEYERIYKKLQEIEKTISETETGANATLQANIEDALVKSLSSVTQPVL